MVCYNPKYRCVDVTPLFLCSNSPGLFFVIAHGVLAEDWPAKQRPFYLQEYAETKAKGSLDPSMPWEIQ